MTVDVEKRSTLKIASGVAAGAFLSSIPLLGSSETVKPSTPGAIHGATIEPDLEITLISSPDVVDNSMVIKNISAHRITIDRFYANNIVFDGDILDCNGSCKGQPIVLDPSEEKVFNVHGLDAGIAHNSSYAYLDAQAVTEYLPRGTRVVSLGASVWDKAAYIHQRSVPA